MEMSTGQVVERMAGDTFLIQDAIGEKVRSFETVGSDRLIAKLQFFFDVHILNSLTCGHSPSLLIKFTQCIFSFFSFLDIHDQCYPKR